MPLKKGASKADFWENVKQLIKDGKPRKQAIAIASKMVRDAGGDPSEWLKKD